MSLKTNMKGPSRPSTSSAGATEPLECVVKVHTNPSRKYSIMQFNRGDNVDFSKWKQAKMERENNMKEFKMLNPDMPTSGAGSEFGRERREEARRKKYGINARKYKEEDQPWILKQIGAPGKKYKGKKEGLVNENSSYYIFQQQSEGTFEATAVDSWYSFTAVAKHKTLNAEEAEEEFNRRDRTFNFFSLMVKKRLKESAGEELSKEDEEEMKAKTSKSSKRKDSLRITEDDDYQDLMTSEESDAYMGDEDEETCKSKAQKKGEKKKKMKKKQQDFDDEGEEESDEGDFEGRELDYISEDSSDDEEEQKKIDIKGLDEELQKIEDEEEEEEEEEEEKEGAETKDADEGKEEPTQREDDSSSSSDIDDSKIQSALLMQQKKPSKRPGTPPSQKTPSKNASRNASRPETPTHNTNANTPATANMLSDAATKLQQHERVSMKRPGTSEGSSSKRPKTEGDLSGGRTPGKEAMGLTEDIVKRYLMRKPMTTKDLLYKLKSKKIGLQPDVIVKRLAEIIRKLNPKQTKIKDKTYWFLKE